MDLDPLIVALYERRVVTAEDLREGIRQREQQGRALLRDAQGLRNVLDRFVAEEARRQERDPPIEASERTYH